MTTLADKAENAIQCVRVAEAEGQAYRLLNDELAAAEDIGDDDFPQYGEWLRVVAVDANQSDLGDRWLECPAPLAESLVEAEIEPGSTFAIKDLEEAEDGAWAIEVGLIDG